VWRAIEQDITVAWWIVPFTLLRSNRSFPAKYPGIGFASKKTATRTRRRDRSPHCPANISPAKIMPARAPQNAAKLFLQNLPEGDHIYYFATDASVIAADIFRFLETVSCEQPPYLDKLTLVV
jgi:hypothetical protein